jgi:hypothetical protein
MGLAWAFCLKVWIQATFRAILEGLNPAAINAADILEGAQASKPGKLAAAFVAGAHIQSLLEGSVMARIRASRNRGLAPVIAS